MLVAVKCSECGWDFGTFCLTGAADKDVEIHATCRCFKKRAKFEKFWQCLSKEKDK